MGKLNPGKLGESRIGSWWRKSVAHAREVMRGGDILQNDIPGGGYPQVTVSDGQQLKMQDCGTFTKQ